MSKLEAAQIFLKELLAKGPLESETIFTNGAVKRLSRSTLRRAKALLGIKARQYLRKWHWEIPGVEGTSFSLTHYGDFKVFVPRGPERIPNGMRTGGGAKFPREFGKE